MFASLLAKVFAAISPLPNHHYWHFRDVDNTLPLQIYVIAESCYHRRLDDLAHYI